MRKIGRVRDIRRYPVSSVGGEVMRTVEVLPGGIVDDRKFALFDASTGLAAAPEREMRWRPAVFLSASQPPDGLPVLHFPDTTAYALDDRALAEHLASYFGFAVALGIYGDADVRFPVVSNRYQPAPLHLVTSASLEALQNVAGLSSIDPRRFRPSVVIDTEDGEGFLENAWIGQRIRIGDLHVDVTDATRRCGMTLIAQPGLDEEPEILRGIMRHNRRNLGVYATPCASATMTVGDDVYAET